LQLVTPFLSFLIIIIINITNFILLVSRFNKRKELLTNSMNKALKKRIVKVLVWPVALYGCESWVMSKEVIERLEAFEIWVWRSLEKVSWEDKMRNEKVLEAVGESRRIIETIERRKKNWIGYVVRGDGLLTLV